MEKKFQLEDDFFKKLLIAIENRIKVFFTNRSFRCELCQNNDWHVSPCVITNSVLKNESFIFMVNKGYSDCFGMYVPISCKTCGNTKFIDPVIIGVVSSSIIQDNNVKKMIDDIFKEEDHGKDSVT